MFTAAVVCTALGLAVLMVAPFIGAVVDESRERRFMAEIDGERDED